MDDFKPKRSSGKRPRKHKFNGNKYRKKTIDSVTNKTVYVKRAPMISSSSKKLSTASHFNDNIFKIDNFFEGYRIIDTSLLFSTICEVACCVKCSGKLKIMEKTTRGLSSKFVVMCENCDSVSTINSCKMIGKKKNAPEINRRSVLAMRAIGKGLEDLKTFCMLMGLPSPVDQKAYDAINGRIKDAVQEVALESMKAAAAEERICSGGNDAIAVSGDGTWKTRGHSSLIGVCTLIGGETGKVLDLEVKSSYCKGCDSYKGVKFGPVYRKWILRHQQVCKKNHDGSAGQMEVDGMVRIFKRSYSLHNLKYLQYIGDGDTKTYHALCEKKPYGPNETIEKVECVGHIQKRMGTRLRKLKLTHGKKKLKDGKTIGGKGRLTDSLIVKLTQYYGNAIRGNSSSLPNMRQAIWAAWAHTFSTDDEPMHWFCPKTPDTWCKFNDAVNKNNVLNFKHKNVLAKTIRDVVKPVFAELSNPKLLKRCLGGKTQNPNESLNSVIWKFCPKTIGSGLTVAEIAANLGCCIFNNGSQVYGTIFEKLELKLRKQTCLELMSVDMKRTSTAEKRRSTSSFEARKARKRQKTKESEKVHVKEGTTYAAGAF